MSGEILEYNLPLDRIAEFPSEDRSASRLLKSLNGQISHHVFKNLPELLPPNSLLVLNDSRVIHARLIVRKSTGGLAEVFCLSPIEPSHDPSISLETCGTTVWEGLIGGKGIVTGSILTLEASGLEFQAEVLSRRQAEATLRFSWKPDHLKFSDVLDTIGKIPLPPYLKREAEESDRTRYQTVYSASKGSVAAPTAGLHFTPEVFKQLQEKGIQTTKVTLHVGAGTFKPIESENLKTHRMHAERISVSIETLKMLLRHLEEKKPVVAVGTTSMRTLESLYWIGLKLLKNEPFNTSETLATKDSPLLEQWDWQRLNPSSSMPTPAVQCIQALVDGLRERGLDHLTGETQIMIIPGYRFFIVQGLITNFHQPRSTLLCLIAAFVGENFWRKIYAEALLSGYRFLSYGDSSLLWNQEDSKS